MDAEIIPILLLVAFITLIWFCGEMSRWVDDDRNQELGIKKATSSYMGAPMRKKFKGFDLTEDEERKKKHEAEKKKKRKEKKQTKGGPAVPGLNMGGIPGFNDIPGQPLIDITPRDPDGTPRLLSARELAEISRGKYVSGREKELESQDRALDREEQEELYRLQIASVRQEVKVRDRHLVELEKSVEEARTRAAVQHEEIVKLAAARGHSAELAARSTRPVGEQLSAELKSLEREVNDSPPDQ